MRQLSRWMFGCVLSLVACAPRGESLDVETLDATRVDPRSDARAPMDAPSSDTSEDVLVADAVSPPEDAPPMGQDARLADGAGDGTLALADGGPLAPDAGDPDGAAPFFPSDFTLPDLNPVSTTHRMDVSPRAMRGRITAWYFGTST